MTTIVFDGKTLAGQLTLLRYKNPLNAGLFLSGVIEFMLTFQRIRRQKL